MAAKKKKVGPQYIALNEWDEAFVRGSREEVIETVEEWLDQDSQLDPCSIKIFKLGDPVKFDVESTRKVYFS